MAWCLSWRAQHDDIEKYLQRTYKKTRQAGNIILKCQPAKDGCLILQKLPAFSYL